MGTKAHWRRAGVLAAVMAASVPVSALPSGSAGATVSPEPQGVRAAGTWGACGSWWSESPGRQESGSVCGVDGLVTENGGTTQVAEPLISVSRYVCVTRPLPRGRRGDQSWECSSENYSGTVRRSEMTVDPLLRRASIRGTLGGCALDVEFAGLGPARPQGNLSEWHGLTPGSPSVSVSGGQTYTSQASWWGGVCGQTVVPPANEDGSQAWMFRGGEASFSHGDGAGDGHA